MEAKSRSQGLLLAGLFVVLALALWWNYGSGANGRATAGGNRGADHRTGPPAWRAGPGCRCRTGRTGPAGEGSA